MRKSKPTSLKATNPSGVLHELEQARLAYEKAGKGHRKALDQAVMKGIEKAEVLENDDRQWSQFQADKRWTKRKERPETLLDALFFSLLFVLEDRKQVSKIRTAIRPYYRDMDLSAADIVDRVRTGGGYEKLAAANRKRKPPTSESASIHVIALDSLVAQGCSFPFDVCISILRRSGSHYVGEVRTW